MSEDLAQKAAERVREVISEAEERAAEIVRRAEAEATEIRERAEADARERIERARRALSEPAGEAPSTPAPVPPAPEPPSAADGAAPGSNAGDDSAARLVAMKMALDGGSREEIAAELESRFGASDRAALLDDVLSRAGR